MADAEHPSSAGVSLAEEHLGRCFGHEPDYANAIRQSLQHLTPTLREVADELKVNYRTLQSYAAMERGTPRRSGSSW